WGVREREWNTGGVRMANVSGVMRAVAIDRFGGPDVLEVKSLPVPEPGPRDVLIRVAYAGVAEWDVYEQEGGFAGMLGGEPTFPYVLGSEGAGVVEDVGAEVERFGPGDRVYAMQLPRGSAGSGSRRSGGSRTCCT